MTIRYIRVIIHLNTLTTSFSNATGARAANSLWSSACVFGVVSWGFVVSQSYNIRITRIICKRLRRVAASSLRKSRVRFCWIWHWKALRCLPDLAARCSRLEKLGKNKTPHWKFYKQPNAKRTQRIFSRARVQTRSYSSAARVFDHRLAFQLHACLKADSLFGRTRNRSGAQFSYTKYQNNLVCHQKTINQFTSSRAYSHNPRQLTEPQQTNCVWILTTRLTARHHARQKISNRLKKLENLVRLVMLRTRYPRHFQRGVQYLAMCDVHAKPLAFLRMFLKTFEAYTANNKVYTRIKCQQTWNPKHGGFQLVTARYWNFSKGRILELDANSQKGAYTVLD